ncbi:thiol:disulfide interchange protein DsbG [Paraburkholderia humisilvae]
MRSLLCVLALTGSIPALADLAIPPVLAANIPKEIAVVRSFQAVDGLTGWVVQGPKGPPDIVYTTADGKYLIAGHILDQSRQDLSSVYAQAMAPKIDVAALWPKIEQTAYVVEGARRPKAIVYAFMDPNCIYCHLLWKAVQPYEKKGLQVRWIPVGLLKPDSGGKAAALLEAKDPAGVMRTLQTKYQEASESGGIAPIKGSATTDAKIRSNGELMKALGFYGTPSLAYRDAGTQEVVSSIGMAKASFVAKILDIPELPVSDPELKRYQ